MASAATLLSRRDEILRAVDPAWLPLIDGALLVSALNAIDALGDGARIAPAPHLIFEALRYGAPADVVAVIIEQNPYDTPADAQGVCFSVPAGAALPESLSQIFGALDRAGLRRERAKGAGAGAGAFVSGDLRPWAAQGVLMFNSAFTTRAGARGAHAALWKPFADEFLRRFCAGRTGVHFLLWGAARAYADLARRHGHVAHEWAHPDPAAAAADGPREDGHFRACPHFEDVNAALAAAGRRPIAWDNLTPVIAFSDGSCSLNGKPGARAAFAALITGAQFGASVIRGEVRPAEYEFVDGDNPELGIRETRTPVAPSNNRGELLGIIYAFLALLRGRAGGRVELASDSKISVSTLLAWLPARLKKGTERELKNFDLVWIAWRLLDRLRAQAACVVLTHVRSHQKPPPISAPTRERFIHRGNALADEHAGAPLKAPVANYSVEVLSAPAVLRTLAAPGGRV